MTVPAGPGSHLDCPLAATLAARMREARRELTHRWLERIVARVSLDPNRVFPTDELLDHVPLLMDGIAGYIEDPADEIASDMPVVAKAMELGELRFSQGFDAYEVLKEYELLGSVLFHFLTQAVEGLDEPCSRAELMQCTHRLFHAVAVIQQVTTTHFLRKLGERVKEREERLRGFNRMVSHELKNRVGAIIGAQQLLREGWLPEEKRARFVDMVGENAEAMRSVLENLTSLSRLDADQRQQRNVMLREAALEAARQLREMARQRGVAIRLADELPPIEVNAAAVELCLSNYLSNAIKYSDPGKTDRWVEVRGEVCARPVDPARGARADDPHADLVVRVVDNGLGVPEEARRKIFQRFFRAHEGTITGIEGTGIGLSLVRETVEMLGGKAWAEFPRDGGTAFVFSLPLRRKEDAG